MALKADVSNKEIMSYLINTKDSGFYGAFTNSDLQNIDDVYEELLGNFSPKRNEFIVSLYKTLGWASVDNTLFNNPLGFVKKAPMRYGAYDRETFVNMLESMDYNFYDGAKELYQIYQSYIMTVYHELRFQKKWAVTISYDELRDAFSEPYGLQSLINSKLAVVPASVEFWEYKAVMSLIDEGYKKQFFYPVQVSVPTNESTAKALLKTIRAYIDMVKFPNPAYNFAGAESPSNADQLLVITTPMVNASLDVDALATLFHIERAEVYTRIVVVDKFENPDLVAMLVDHRFFRWRDQLHQMGGANNVDALRTNFFYHAWELISASPFYTTIALTHEAISITTITPADDQTFTNGSQTPVLFTITGTAGAYVPQGFILKITSDTTSPETMIIPGTNILLVGTDETATSITVAISSTYDETKTANVTLTKE